MADQMKLRIDLDEGAGDLRPGPALSFPAPNVDLDLISAQLDRLDTAMWIFDFDHKRFLWANQKFLEIMSSPSIDELLSRDLAADMSPSVDTRLRQYKTDFCKEDVSFTESWTLYPKGQAKTLHTVFRGIRLNDGRMAMFCEGVESHERRPDALRSAEAVLYTTVMISLFSMEGRPLYRNTAARAASVTPDASFSEMFAKASQSRALLKRLQTDKTVRFVCKVRTSSGLRWHELTLISCQDAATGDPAFLVSEIDVTELHETKERAQYLASHDSLTGLSNRTYLTERVSQMLASAEEQDRRAAVYLVDLDDFKLVNDSMGHAAGDALLQLVAAKLRDLSGNRDIVARLGGDEFLICRSLASDEDPATLGNALQKAFSHPQNIDGKYRSVSMSIGYACFPEHGAGFSKLLRHADLALYQAKISPSAKCLEFDDSMRRLRDRRLAFGKDISRALVEGEFRLFFQPIVCTTTDRIVSAEALIRWQHPEKGWVMPDEFIQIAEENGQIQAIGNWVCQTAARFQTELQDQGIDLPISINVSPRQVSHGDFVQEMLALPEQTGCDPEKLSLEITENVLLGDVPNTSQTLETLKTAGYQIVIDDFGTGYSNLAYLHNYPIDVIKIDRSFMSDLETGGAIVRLILSLAVALGASVVAEGVETVAQRDWLSKNGCNRHQGFLYSPAVSMEDLRQMLMVSVPVSR